MSHLCKRQLGETVTSERGGQEASFETFYIINALGGTWSLLFFFFLRKTRELIFKVQRLVEKCLKSISS